MSLFSFALQQIQQPQGLLAKRTGDSGPEKTSRKEILEENEVLVSKMVDALHLASYSLMDLMLQFDCGEKRVRRCLNKISKRHNLRSERIRVGEDAQGQPNRRRLLYSIQPEACQ